MKGRSMILLAIATALVFITSAFVVALDKAPTSAKEVIITASDMSYQGWRQDHLSSSQMVTWGQFELPNDTFESMMLNDAHPLDENRSNDQQTMIVVEVMHFNSTSDARSAYQGFYHPNHYSSDNYTPIQIGDEGFMISNSYATGLDQQLIFIKGNYLVLTSFSWSKDLIWSSADSLKVAEIQANKIP